MINRFSLYNVILALDFAEKVSVEHHYLKREENIAFIERRSPLSTSLCKILRLIEIKKQYYTKIIKNYQIQKSFLPSKIIFLPILLKEVIFVISSVTIICLLLLLLINGASIAPLEHNSLPNPVTQNGEQKLFQKLIKNVFKQLFDFVKASQMV